MRRQVVPLASLQLTSDFLQYMVDQQDRTQPNEDPERIPPLQKLSKDLKVSVATLREQLEVARVLGIVDVRPRTGIRRQPYSFLPAVRQSLAYAIQTDRSYFEAFADLRNQVEGAFWRQAVQHLTLQDHQTLQTLVDKAQEKLRGNPIRIPHAEHRQLHLCIFSRLDNIFVQGIIEAYWDAYETVGLNVYADYDYLQEVWQYHQKMVKAICEGKFDAGYTALVEHKELLRHRPHLFDENNIETKAS
jgi:DNA-binding FadR family transcriptional regulator